MGYQVLARKWRPRKFEEVVGQRHITKALQNAVLNDRVGHAYLFSGTRGIGKTSIARIFSKALTCQNLLPDGNPCNECEACTSAFGDNSLDIQEIDGASHNGVENIRALIENIHYAPVFSRYRVYIIDEVHMLSSSAFNALLKTLEEPPKHVVFILATTDPEKLLPTVLSRCQRLDFKNATVNDLVAHLKMILETENIQIESDGILRRLARQGKGSIRDTLSLMDQVLSYSMDETLTEEVVSRALGLVQGQALADLISAVFVGDDQALQEKYYEVLNENVSLKNIAQGLLDYLFFIIERYQFKDKLYEENLIHRGSIDHITHSEIFWIYETMAKDFTWALDSIDPESVLCICLKKLSLRREFFKKTGDTITNQGQESKKKDSTQSVVEVKKEEIQEPVVEAQTEVSEVSEIPVETSIIEESTPEPAQEVQATEPKTPVQDSEEEPPMPTDADMPMEAQAEVQVEQVAIPQTSLSVSDVIEAVENNTVDELIPPSEEEIEAAKEEAEAVTQSEEVEERLPAPSSDEVRTWEGFLSYLGQHAPATGANIEQGNLITPIRATDEIVELNIGFPKSASVFMEHLSEPQIKERICELAGSYFGHSEDKVKLIFEIVSGQEERFVTVAQKKEDLLRAEEDRQRNEFLNNEFVVEAQKIFNAKVDRVILNTPN